VNLLRGVLLDEALRSVFIEIRCSATRKLMKNVPFDDQAFSDLTKRSYALLCSSIIMSMLNS
jgi:hypothetical protein